MSTSKRRTLWIYMSTSKRRTISHMKSKLALIECNTYKSTYD